MKLRTLLLGFVLGLLPITAMAGTGSGHDHGHSHEPINQSTANLMATNIIVSFVKQKTIDKSWESTTVSSSEKKTFNGRKEWVVSFVNEKVTNANERKLYIFLTLSGDYIAANYTGK